MLEREKVACRLLLCGHPIWRQVTIESQANWPSRLPKLQEWW